MTALEEKAGRTDRTLSFFPGRRLLGCCGRELARMGGELPRTGAFMTGEIDVRTANST